MQVKIKHLIPHILDRIEAYEEKTVWQKNEELQQKMVYESKFLSRLFNWKYKPHRDPYSYSYKQLKEMEATNFATLVYYLDNEIKDTVLLSDFIGWGSHDKIQKDILNKYFGEYNEASS